MPSRKTKSPASQHIPFFAGGDHPSAPLTSMAAILALRDHFQAPSPKAIDDARRHLVATLGAILDKQLSSDTILFSVGRRGQGMSMLRAYLLLTEMRRGETVYTNFELPMAIKETIGKYGTIIEIGPGKALKGNRMPSLKTEV